MLNKRNEPGSLKNRFVTRVLLPGTVLLTSFSLTANAQQIVAANDPGKSDNNSAITKKADGNGTETGKAVSVKTDPSEMAKTVELLEERIRQLEEKLSRFEAATKGVASITNPDAAGPVVAPTAQETAELKKEIEVLREETKKNAGFLGFFREVELSGLVDGYYSYNNNKVTPFGRSFDYQQNNFSLQLAKLTLEKKNSKESPLGFRADFAFGDTVDRVISAAPTANDAAVNNATKHLLQAYLSYVAPVGNGLTIEFGKFVTPVGSEVIETKDNFNYSRSFLFNYGPYYHAGFRAKYAFNSKVALTGLVVNGWDKLFDNNGAKTFGASLALTPTSRFSITETYLVGKENPYRNALGALIPARNTLRHIADTVASFVVNDKLTLLGNFAYTADKNPDGTNADRTGTAVYLKYQMNDRWAFAPRFEVFNDMDGALTGTRQTLKGLTLTQELKLVNNLLTRFEYRRDFSNQRFFTNSDGRNVNNQNTFLVGLSYFFTSKGQ